MTQIEFERKRAIMCEKITGCAFAAYNYWHAGVDELVYEAGLCNLKMLVILYIVKRIFRFIIRVDRRRLIGDLIL